MTLLTVLTKCCFCRNVRIAEMEGQVALRPMSRERLPAMEGFKEGLAPETSAQSEVMSM